MKTGEDEGGNQTDQKGSPASVVGETDAHVDEHHSVADDDGGDVGVGLPHDFILHRTLHNRNNNKVVFTIVTVQIEMSIANKSAASVYSQEGDFDTQEHSTFRRQATRSFNSPKYSPKHLFEVHRCDCGFKGFLDMLPLHKPISGQNKLGIRDADQRTR